ncbi:MAG: hypothetical protein HN389_05700 [Clostridia bacterium]|nr:hypothetical protein [Clostridia bacterium]
MARNPENAYGIGTGGAKRVTDESLQMARNPENAYGIGTGGVRGNESTAENAYGQHTGGVSGNYKPPALREAEQAVTAFDIAFSIIEEQTGVSDQATIMANIETAARGENGAIDESSTWGQAAMLLNEAEMETGMTLGEADHLLAVEQGNFEEYKKVEAVKAEAAERFGELEDYDDSPVDWQNNSVDLVGQRADELEYYSKATGDVDDLLTGGKIAEKFDLLSNKEKDALAYGLLSGEMSGKEYSLLTDEEKDAIVYDILSGGMSHAEYAVLSDEEKEIAYDFLPANEKRKLRAAFFSEYENMDEDMIAQYTDDEALGSRKLELAEGDAGRKHYEDNYEIAMDGELGDLDGMQLFIRAENDIQNIINETNSEIEAIPGFKQIKQDTINMGLADFDDAMQAWMEGDSSDIQTLLTVTYGGTMLLDDEDLDFNDFRDEYVKYCWDSQKYEDDLIKPILDARDQKLEKYHETMRPYLEEQMKFVETGDGFYMTLTPDIIEYAVAFAGEQGAPLIDSEMTDVLGAGAGVAVAFITGNPAAGALISIMTIMGGRELDKKHLWDKTASALEHYIDTDKPLFVSVHDDRVDIIEIEKE